MRYTPIGFARLVAAFTVAAALGFPITQVAATSHDDLAQKVQGAKTAADHEALAAQYDKAAAEAKAQAAMHRKMGESYKGQPAVTGGKAVGVSAMPQHCDSLAQSFDQQAEMYTAMATGERELAKAAK